MESSFSEYTNLQSIIKALESNKGTNSDLANKVEYSLQLSIGKVVYRNNNFTEFLVTIGEDEFPRPAVLFYNSKFYVLNGYPKLGEDVIVIHNNGNNAHIMFSANPKDKNDPPFSGKHSVKAGIFSSAKCSL